MKKDAQAKNRTRNIMQDQGSGFMIINLTILARLLTLLSSVSLWWNFKDNECPFHSLAKVTFQEQLKISLLDKLRGWLKLIFV